MCRFAKKPFCASHSNARSLCHRGRNLPDELIRGIAKRGGVIGANYYGPFLTATPDVLGRFYGYASDIAAHIRHIADVGGIDCIGLGSDFDGIDNNLELKNCGSMRLLEQALKKVQPDGAPLHVVHQPPRGGHHDLGLFLQLVDLGVDGLAAVEAHHPHTLLKGAQVPQFVLDLDGQLPGGGQHQAGDVGGGRVGVLHHGDAKGEGLAGPSGGLGNHVLPVHKPGDGPGLDGGGLHIALLLDGPHQLR